MSDLSINYVYHLAFKALRPVRAKYRLTINMILVLNACYLYQKHVGTAFSQTAIQKFFTYYSIPKMQTLMKVLEEKGFIYASDFAQWQLYKMTRKGINAIECLDEEYNKLLQEFTNQYNINL